MSTTPATVYAYRPEALVRLKRRRKSLMAPIIVMMMALIFAGPLVLAAPFSSSFRGFLIVVTFFSLVVVYVALATTRTIMTRTHRFWSDYKIIVDSNGIERSQSETPSFRLNFSDIEVIEETPGVGIRLNPGNSLRSIFVPEGIENYSTLRARLIAASRAPVRVRKYVWAKAILGALAAGAAVAVVLRSWHFEWVMPIASLAIAFFVWVFVLIQRSPNSSRTVRSTSWAYLALAALCAWRIWYLSRFR